MSLKNPTAKQKMKILPAAYKVYVGEEEFGIIQVTVYLILISHV